MPAAPVEGTGPGAQLQSFGSVSSAAARTESVVGAVSGNGQSAIAELQPDPNDPMVVRAKSDLARVEQLINEGAIPRLRLEEAQDDLADALDMSILKKNIYSKEIAPEQADELVGIADRMVARRQREALRMRELVSSGVISIAEAQAGGADLERSRTELDLAISRANLVRQIADSMKFEKSIAALESQAETHTVSSGRLYTRYDGNGSFSAADRRKVEFAFTSRFAKPLPVSADGETSVHRSLGFDHRGRLDVSLNPDSAEGLWLLSYLKRNHIPYFAFRAAIPHRATGAHIHIGPQSSHLTMAD